MFSVLVLSVLQIHRDNKTKLLVYSLWSLPWQSNFSSSCKETSACWENSDEVAVRGFLPLVQARSVGAVASLHRC